MRLLLIDDHPLFVDGFATMIAQARPDWHFAFAHSSTEGVARLVADPDFALVLVDLQLPDRDGFATIAAIAAVCPHLPASSFRGARTPPPGCAHRSGARAGSSSRACRPSG